MYRNRAVLAQEGADREDARGSGDALAEDLTQDHHHLVCRSCHDEDHRHDQSGTRPRSDDGEHRMGYTAVSHAST